MKTRQMNQLTKLLNIALILIVLAYGCSSSDKSDHKKTEKTAKVGVKAEKPKIDIQTAIITDNVEIVRQHIEAGTNINVKDQLSGSTPLITAATFGKKEIAKLLIDANAALDIKNNEGSTALHSAAFFCHIEIVQMLMDAGADKTIKNNHGATPRDAVIGPFAELKPVYEMLQQQLEPLGLKLDYQELEQARPVIAMMLQ